MKTVEPNLVLTGRHQPSLSGGRSTDHAAPEAGDFQRQVTSERAMNRLLFREVVGAMLPKVEPNGRHSGLASDIWRSTLADALADQVSGALSTSTSTMPRPTGSTLPRRA